VAGDREPMDPDLRRCLDRIFALLVGILAANLAGSVGNLTELFFWLVVAGVFGGMVYELLVRPDDGV